MGNCLVGATSMGDGNPSIIKVATSHGGGVMEFSGPVTVESITDEFPGHGIFRSHDLFWRPLPHADPLLAGESYHLLPLVEAGHVGHVRSKSAPPKSTEAPPYRISCDSRGVAKLNLNLPSLHLQQLGSAPPYRVAKRGEEEGGGVGFWKVKLVISPEQLAEILGEECRTEELIESVRTVAKCGSGGLRGFSDQWSLSSSRNAASSSNKDKDSLFDF